MNKPITCVAHADALTYCRLHHKRLPTLDEWEYAARGVDERSFPWGNDAPTAEHVTASFVDADDVGAHPKGRSPFGIFDLGGNVREWTATQTAQSEGRDEYAVAGDVWFGVTAALDLKTFDLYDRHFAFTWHVAPAALTAEGIGFRCVSTPEVGNAAKE